ncbi:MAG: histidinol dehydrogenase [Actinomycetia bacterium]|nr:histidinol dehydrogenase [Actinomycetes bacterium]
MRVEYLEAGESPSDEMLGRGAVMGSVAVQTAAEIVAAVRERGDEAVKEYMLKLDKADRQNLMIGLADLDNAWKRLSPSLQEALKAAYQSIRNFHEQQKQQSWFITRPDGALVGSRVAPLSSVGVYVPGGRAAYPSSLLMNVIPAQVAGVERIVVVTPPQPDGNVSQAVLAAARLANITEVYAVGGAQAVAALAYGTEQIPAVDKIVGPGNAYVTAAKRLVAGDVGIDMIAGPSEVAILADDSSDATLVAIDMLAQAEHDPEARTYLVTIDENLVDDVIEQVEKQLGRSTRQEISKESIDRNCVVLVCPDLSTALTAINRIAPEHLELQVEAAMELLGLVENAGAIFCGPWSPVSVGDYLAGPSHTLPTGGSARFASPLSVADFVKHSSVISYSYAALENDATHIKALADAEGLWAHGRAVELRFEDDEG